MAKWMKYGNIAIGSMPKIVVGDILKCHSMYVEISRYNPFLLFTQELMDSEKGWYDQATDSIILYLHVFANALCGVK
jgi:hypothetical protein